MVLALRFALVLSAFLALASPAAAFEFVDVAEDVGLDFRHAASADTYNYLEVTGSGLCWGDVDGDGTDDLFFVNGEHGNATLQEELDPRSALYLNDGDGTFTDASAEWRADLSGWGQSCSLADYDGDADLDLLVVGYDFLRFLRNDDPFFTDVTAETGITLEEKCGEGVRCYGTSSSWADYDRDGDLDVYVTNYVDWDLREGGEASPALYNGQPNQLWRNDGNGTFTDVTQQAGVRDAPGPNHSKSFQGIWADYDRDGWIDLFITSDETADTLFRNKGDGTFADVAGQLGVADPRAGMGLNFQDATADGLPDLFMTHYHQENNGFYQNRPGEAFLDRSGEGDLDEDWTFVGWGTGFFDFDHDGDADLYCVNGDTELEEDDPVRNHAQEGLIWRQLGDKTFHFMGDQSGPGFDLARVSRGSAVADYDLDGDVDIAILASFNETALLLRNDNLFGSWLQVELREPDGLNRFGIGAEVEIQAPGRNGLHRTIQASTSFLSQDSLVAHAGLGPGLTADITVRWPDGTSQTWSRVASDERVRLVKGSVDVIRDTLSPVTSILADGPGRDNWFRDDVSISLSAADRSMGVTSGVASTEFRIDDGPWTPYAGPFVLTAEGRHTIRARSTDVVGNQEPVRLLTVGIDRQAPVSTAHVAGDPGEDEWFRSPAAIVVHGDDEASGLLATNLQLDDGPWQPVQGGIVERSGIHQVNYFSEDVAGNAEAVRTLTVKVDEDPPTVLLLPQPVAAAVASVRVEADADDQPSGVRRALFFVDGEEAPRFVDTDGSDGWSFTLSEVGVHRIRVVVRDAVDLEAESETRAVIVPSLPLPPLALLLPSFLPLVGARRTAVRLASRSEEVFP